MRLEEKWKMENRFSIVASLDAAYHVFKKLSLCTYTTGCFGGIPGDVFVIFLNICLFNWMEADVKNRDVIFVFAGLAVIAALILYITVKPYSMD